MGDDLKTLADLPDGTITVDLLNGEARHSSEGAVELYISKEINTWLQYEWAKEHFDQSQIKSGLLEVAIKSSKLVTKKKSLVTFHFDCSSQIETAEASYCAKNIEMHRWYL